MVRVPTHREPTHPGEVLLQDFLIPMGLTPQDLAEAIHVPYPTVNEIISKRRRITVSTAMRLAKFFGVSVEFWLDLQLRLDLYHIQQKEGPDLDAIQPYSVA